MRRRKYILRFSSVFFALIFCLLFFCVKLIFIQVFRSEHLTKLAEKQQKYLIEIEPIRGSIYDRNLRPLAFNVSVFSLFANPKILREEDRNRIINELPLILNMDPEVLRERLLRDKYFVWIKRKLPMEIAEEIKKLHIKGLGFRKESKRFYPNGELAAHVIGFANVDNKGLEGLELFYDQYLRGKPGRMRILRDARQRELLMGDSFYPPQDGFHVVLTIDETIQYITERALLKSYEKYKAKGATVIVMDVRTGEILALANQPTYNLQNFQKSSIESRTNRAVSYVYEPGSVFKLVTAAAALEEEAFIEEDVVFCENGNYRVANNILHDHHPYGNLSFQEVFEHSSNIGVTKIAQKLGGDIIYKYARRFQFGKKTGVDLKGEVPGLLKPPSTWSKTSIGAIPIGHEVLTTPLQLVAAFSAVANDGVFMKPHIVKYIKDQKDQIIKEFKPQIVDRVISVDTARRVKAILQGVVERGTGKRARIKGVTVGGKTGTAQKVVNGRYSHSQFYATFVGFAPVENSRLTVIAVFDDPRSSYFGGTVAAPVVKEVLENSLKYLENKEK